MTLSPLDEYPIHQAPISMRHVVTSDRNFYDRSYFNLHASDDRLFVIFGMGQYANLGVQDAYVLAADAETHRVVRASRALGLDRMDTSVGPMRIDVIEGLRKVRFVCDPHDADGTPLAICCDVTWEGTVPACDDLGRATLDLTIEDSTRTVTAATWHLHEPDGAPFDIDVAILLPVWVGKGTGYGFDDDWRHGMWQGELVVQDVRWDLTDPEVAATMFGIRDAVARFTWGDRVGHGCSIGCSSAATTPAAGPAGSRLRRVWSR